MFISFDDYFLWFSLDYIESADFHEPLKLIYGSSFYWHRCLDTKNIGYFSWTFSIALMILLRYLLYELIDYTFPLLVITRVVMVYNTAQEIQALNKISIFLVVLFLKNEHLSW